MTSAEVEVRTEVEEPSESLMVTVSIIGPDGTSWHGSGHQVMGVDPPTAEQVVHLLSRAALGACMAHDDDTWLALRRVWTRYPAV